VPPRGAPITVELWGTEFDGWFESEEKAQNADENLEFPSGFARETVSDQTQTLWASPSPGDNFAFAVTMKYRSNTSDELASVWISAAVWP
jgi:hypothetical protein